MDTKIISLRDSSELFWAALLTICCIIGCQNDTRKSASQKSSTNQATPVKQDKHDTKAAKATQDSVPESSQMLAAKPPGPSEPLVERYVPPYEIKVPSGWQCQKLKPKDVRFKRCFDPNTGDEFNIKPIKFLATSEQMKDKAVPKLLVEKVIASSERSWPGYQLISTKWSNKNSKRKALTFERWFHTNGDIKTIGERILFSREMYILHLGVFVKSTDAARTKKAKSIVSSFSAPITLVSEKQPPKE
jgi:hypothetical protein